MRKVETFLLHIKENIMYFQFVDTHSDIWIHWNNSCFYNHHHPCCCHHHHHHHHQHVYTVVFWFMTLCSLVWCYKCFGWNSLLLCSRQKWVKLGLGRSYSSSQCKGWRSRDKTLPMSMETGNRIGPNGSLQKERLFWRDKVTEESWVTWKCTAYSSLFLQDVRGFCYLLRDKPPLLFMLVGWSLTWIYCLIRSMSLYFYTRMPLYSWMWQHRFMLSFLDDNDSCAYGISEISRLHIFHYRTRLYFMAKENMRLSLAGGLQC